MKRMVAFTLFFVLAWSLTASVAAQEGSFFRTIGGWDNPPTWQGNPYAPGCCGTAWWYVFEPLFYYVPADDSIVMSLAESYELDEEAMVATVVLREGSTWHDGTPVTAQDVWTTFALEQAFNNLIWRFLDDVEVVDDRTIRFHWNQLTPFGRPMIDAIAIRGPNHIYGEYAQELWDIAEFYEAQDLADPEVTAEMSAAQAPIVESLQAVQAENPVGTGPFYVDTVTESTMILRKFDGHPAAEQVGFDGVRVERAGSNDLAWSMIQTGLVDAYHPGTPPDVVEGLTASGEIQQVLVSDLAESAIYFNPETYDQPLRAALTKAINRQQLRELGSFYGLDTGDHATGVLQSMEDRWLERAWMDETLTAYPYDPEAAAADLKALGYSKSGDQWLDANGQPLELTVTAPAQYQEWVTACESTVQQLSSFGIASQCQPRDLGVYWTDLDALDYDIAMGWFATYWGTGHPYTGYNNLYAPENSTGTIRSWLGIASESQQYAGLEGEMLTPRDLVIELAGTTAFEDQQAIVRQLAYITNENLFAMPFFEKQLQIFINTGAIEGWPAADDPIWTMAGGAIDTLYTALMVNGQLQPIQ